jgi:hypothetical protein
MYTLLGLRCRINAATKGNVLPVKCFCRGHLLSYYGRRYCLRVISGCLVTMKTVHLFYKYRYNLLKYKYIYIDLNIWEIVTSQCFC